MLTEFRDKLPKMPEVIIEGILLEGHKMLLTGPSKANKTWRLISLAASVATGGAVFDNVREAPLSDSCIRGYE